MFIADAVFIVFLPKASPAVAEAILLTPDENHLQAFIILDRVSISKLLVPLLAPVSCKVLLDS